jgi:F0F1-type ATP synthase assembly protein I
MAQSEQKGRSILINLLIVLVGQVGCLTLIVILASVFLGLWLDGIFGTKPVVTLALLLAGIPVSVILMLFVSRKTLAKLKELSGSPSESGGASKENDN